MTTVLLSSAYFGPIQWYQKINRYSHTLIESYDSFIKQTYRNRCLIATANGLQALTVPVLRCRESSLMRDIRISDHGNWRHLHWNALVSAYGESPFFEFYADDLHPFFERKWQFLFDFNMEITHTMCSLLDVRSHISTTSVYKHGDDIIQEDDFRDVIKPKHPLPDPAFLPRPYYQVYANRHGFQPNLSILDLLFNMGPEGIFYL